MKKVIKIICVLFSQNLLISNYDCIKGNEIGNQCKYKQIKLAETKEKDNRCCDKV